MLYEKQENNQYAVHRWSGEATGSLKEDINNAILANRGIACVGEQTKAIVGRIAELRAEGTIPAPVSARAAFGHPVLRHRTDYIRTTVYLLC